MPYMARLYGTRKKSVPMTRAASTRPVVRQYAAANGYAVLIQLMGRDATNSWRSGDVPWSSVIAAPAREERPQRREQDDGGDRVREVLERRRSDSDAPDAVRCVGH